MECEIDRYCLTDLQNRTKWKHDAVILKVCDLVTVKTSKVPFMDWPIARIVKVIPGLDRKIRVVDVATERCLLTFRKNI